MPGLPGRSGSLLKRFQAEAGPPDATRHTPDGKRRPIRNLSAWGCFCFFSSSVDACFALSFQTIKCLAQRLYWSSSLRQMWRGSGISWDGRDLHSPHQREIERRATSNTRPIVDKPHAKATVVCTSQIRRSLPPHQGSVTNHSSGGVKACPWPIRNLFFLTMVKRDNLRQ